MAPVCGCTKAQFWGAVTARKVGNGSMELAKWWRSPRGVPQGTCWVGGAALTVDLDDFLHGMHGVSICSLLENLLRKRVKLDRERGTPKECHH